MAARFNCCVDKKDLVATLDWNQALMKDVSSRLIINYSDTLILLAPPSYISKSNYLFSTIKTSHSLHEHNIYLI